jgi:hypothetical protein
MRPMSETFSPVARVGKIARLPRAVRAELNRRLAEGEVGRELLGWLNALPEVQSVLATKFGGRPINDQNLSDWRHGGFADWLEHEEMRGRVQIMVEEERELQQEAKGRDLTDGLALQLVALMRLRLHELPAEPDRAKRDRAVARLTQQLTALQRARVGRERSRREQERREAERAAQEKKASEEAAVKAEREAKWERIRASVFPHLDKDGLPLTRAQSAAQEKADMDEGAEIALRYLQAWGEIDNGEAAEENEGDSSQFRSEKSTEDLPVEAEEVSPAPAPRAIAPAREEEREENPPAEVEEEAPGSPRRAQVLRVPAPRAIAPEQNVSEHPALLGACMKHLSLGLAV